MKFIMLMINIGVYNHPSKHFAIEGRKVVVALDAFVVRSVASSGRMLYGHGDGDSRMKLPCPSTESSHSDSRVSASMDSLTQGFSISRGSTWKIMVVS